MILLGPYFVAFFLSLAVAALSVAVGKTNVADKNLEKPQPALYIMSCLVLIVFIGLRDGVGTDFSSVYEKGFFEIVQTGTSRFELGFTLLCLFCSWLSDSPHFLFFVSAIITYGLSYLAIYRFSSNVLLSLFILLFGGFLAYSTNAVRQMIALAILFNSVDALRKSNLPRYLFYVAVASSFHISALFFLILYPLKKYKISYGAAVLSLVLLWLSRDMIIGLTGQLVYWISPHLAQYFSPTNPYAKIGDYDLADLAQCTFAFICFALVEAGFRKDKSDCGRVYFWLVYLGVLISLLSGRLFILSRLAIFFSCFAVLYMPYCLSKFPDKLTRRFVTFLYLCLLVGSFVYLYFILGMNDLFPYQSAFFSTV